MALGVTNGGASMNRRHSLDRRRHSLSVVGLTLFPSSQVQIRLSPSSPEDLGGCSCV